jgi:hypothetical protein
LKASDKRKKKPRYNLDRESIIWLLKISFGKNHPHYNNGLFILHNLFAIIDPLLELTLTGNKSMHKKKSFVAGQLL